MIHRILLEWRRQGLRTTAFPDAPASLKGRFRGRFALDAAKCPDGCRACAEVCPTDAFLFPPEGTAIDLGRCLFCTACVDGCPEGAVRATNEPAMAASARTDLHLRGEEMRLASALDAKMRSLFGRSLRLRQVCAGGCSGCEAELVATGNTIFDLSRFGIGFVASPRHADGLVVTGPVTQNMRHALLETYEAIPPPRLVIAVGACAISGGIFREGPETLGGVEGLLPVDLYIPGCPPHPITLLDGLLRLLGRMPAATGGKPVEKPRTEVR